MKLSFDFHKMSGHGNDFVLVDNWDGKISKKDMPKIARTVCRRRVGVGADGMVFIEEGPADVDFGWHFYNADGSEAEMCGNAGRCTAKFAYTTGIAPAQMSFMTLAGIIRAEVIPLDSGKDTVRIQMTRPGEPEMDIDLEIAGQTMQFSSINTGVPHAVAWVESIEKIDVVELGRAVRYHSHFEPAGANANFVQILGADRLAIRTYERGVEDETLACGTGTIAAVLLSALKGMVNSPARVLTRGGEVLIVHYTRSDNGFDEVFLEGPVCHVYSGTIGPDLTVD